MTTESEQFKKFILELNINQRDLAKVLGKSQSTIAKYCSGDYYIPFEVVKLLHKKFKMSYDWYFDNKGSITIEPKELKKTLVSDVTDLRSTVRILEGKLKTLTRNFDSLHTEYHDFKHNLSKQNPV